MPGTKGRTTAKRHHLPSKTTSALRNLANAAVKVAENAKKAVKAASLEHHVAVRKALTQGGMRDKKRTRKNRH